MSSFCLFGAKRRHDHHFIWGSTRTRAITHSIFIGCFSGSTVAYNGNAHKSYSYLFILLLCRSCRCTFSSPVFHFICCWRCVDYWQSFSIIMWTLNTHIRPPHTHTHIGERDQIEMVQRKIQCVLNTTKWNRECAWKKSHTHKSDAKNERRKEWRTKQRAKKEERMNERKLTRMPNVSLCQRKFSIGFHQRSCINFLWGARIYTLSSEWRSEWRVYIRCNQI